jgi:hypothetical protein
MALRRQVPKATEASPAQNTSSYSPSTCSVALPVESSVSREGEEEERKREWRYGPSEPISMLARGQ